MTPATAARAPEGIPALASWGGDGIAGGFALATICLTAALGGAYFPETWGWVALSGLVVAAAAVLTLERIEGGLRDAAFVGALLALYAWTALSLTWTDSVPRTVSELERDLLYVAGVAAAVAVSRRRSVEWLLAGVLAGVAVVSLYALATKLIPGVLGYGPATDYRLVRPLGYSNAVGIVAATGALLALGFAASGRGRLVRSLAASLIPLFVTTLYFTFGRGAWLALAAGLVVAVATNRERLRLAAHAAALGGLAAIAVWLASRPAVLTTADPPHAAAAHAGHALAAKLAAVVVAAAAVALALERVPASIGSRRLRAATALVAAAIVVAAAAVVAARAGGPAGLAAKAYHSFTGSNGALLTRNRVFVLSGTGRSDYWHVAAREYARHPWLGSGAGTFDLYWHRDRPTSFGALDAHSLYLETLAELGPVGLLLLVIALGVPLVALARASGGPLVAAAGGAYFAFLVHAGVDWDWELPTVTLVGLFCGVAPIIAARHAGRAVPLGRRVQAPALAVVGALAAFAAVAQLGNAALRQSQEALDGGNYGRAEERAVAARRWAPWSAEARLALAAAQTARGETGDAVSTLEAAVRKDPRDWEPWFQLALATRGSRRAQALARAAQLNPLAPEIAALRGAAAVDGGR